MALSVKDIVQVARIQQDDAVEMEQMAALNATPFPAGQYPADVYWRKHPEFTGRIPNADLQSLYASGCIDVTNLPACDLPNVIHDVFTRRNFPSLSAQEYAFLAPALRLACKFIMQTHYLEFFDWLCASETHKLTIKKTAAMKDTVEYLNVRPQWQGQVAAIRNTTLTELNNLATNVRFFMKDNGWSNADPGCVGETCPDIEEMNCKKHAALNNGQNCGGTCKYCRVTTTQVCPICGDRWYKKLLKPELMQHAVDRGITDHNGRDINLLTVAQLKAALAALEVTDGERAQPPIAKNYETTFAQRSNFRIGLHIDFIRHIRARATAGWTTAQETRFQFSVATTLVHEVVHAFWFFASKRCWQCFDEDPCWKRTERENYGPRPELGNSWEYWAFGSRVPVGVHMDNAVIAQDTNNFQQCHWSYIYSTDRGGRSKYPVIEHDYVVPVQYMSAWFQEATWRRIENRGRQQGRPDHAEVVILHEEPCSVDANGDFAERECTVAGYDFARLVNKCRRFMGGKAAKKLAYGTKFDNSTKISKFKKQLVAKRKAKPNKGGKAPRKKTP